MGLPFWRTASYTTISNSSLKGSSIGRTLGSHLSPPKKDTKRFQCTFKQDVLPPSSKLVKGGLDDCVARRDTKEAPRWLTPCRNLNKPGGCQYGSKCHYSHTYTWGDKLVDADMYMENLPAINGTTKQHEIEQKIMFVKEKASPFGIVGQVNPHVSKKANGEWSCNIHFLSMKACKDFVDAMQANGNPYNARINGITDYSPKCQPVTSSKNLASTSQILSPAPAPTTPMPVPKEQKRERKKAIVDNDGWTTFESKKKVEEPVKVDKPVEAKEQVKVDFPPLHLKKQSVSKQTTKESHDEKKDDEKKEFTVVEKRIARDGLSYTKDEFIVFFGNNKGEREWNDAKTDCKSRRLVSISELIGNQNMKKTHFGSVSFADLLKEATEPAENLLRPTSEAGPSNISMLLAADEEDSDSDSDSSSDYSSPSDDSDDEEDVIDDIVDDHKFAKYFDQMRKYAK